MADVPKIDEFTFILFAGFLLMFILVYAWGTPGEGSPVVVENSFSIKAVPGEDMKFNFEVTSAKQGLTAVNITATGEMSDWITFNKNNFDVSKGGLATVVVTVDPPEDTELGLYTGRVQLKGKGGTDSFSLNIEIVEESEMDESNTRIIPNSEFPSEFSVSYAKGSDVLDSRENVRVSKSHISSRSTTLTGLITDDRMDIITGGSLQLVIEDTNNIGNIIVLLNDQRIYNKMLSTGEVLIPIDKEMIERANIIEIKASSPGWMFWAGTKYDIRSVKFAVNYEGAFAQTFNITLNDYEADNFKKITIFGRVKNHEAVSEMIIKVNNQIAYWQTPPLTIFEATLEEDMFGNPLYVNEGDNTITMMFEKNAEYEMTDAMMTVEFYE